MPPLNQPQSIPEKKLLPIVTIVSGLFVLFVIWTGIKVADTLLNSAPKDFPDSVRVTIPPGTNAKQTATILKESGLIRSELYFYLVLLWQSDPTTIKASTYYFDEVVTTREIIDGLQAGQFANDLTRVTFTEGIRLTEFARIAEANLPEFDEVEFLRLATDYEGRLYPDTYLVPPAFTAKELFVLLTETHEEVMTDLRTNYDSTLSAEDAIILASILEREANSEESMKMVSGILQNRLAINMALQADATMEYVLDKPLSELLPSDLQRESPYNTYLNVGLPPTAIGNPGRTALEAAFNPTPSDYLFYITGNDGQFYYARDFDEHRINIARHLR